jgi:hypothetical protein
MGRDGALPLRVKITAALGAAVLFGGGAYLVSTLNSGGGSPAAQAAPPRTHTAAPPPTPAPTTSAAPTPTHTAPPHQFVAPAAPTSFEIKGKAFDIKARVCKMAYVRPLDPPGDQRHTVCWVKADFGVAPASTSRGTSYILGHAWAEAPLVLNKLSEFAMREVNRVSPTTENGVRIWPVTGMNGYTITLGTAKGVLRYQVTRAFAVTKETAADIKSVMAEHTPNRVVLITCGELGSKDYNYNIIVYAQLISSRARVT